MFASLPITALRVFESAARHLSFKAAAAELSVTPAAVSHQVRALESCLGVALFTRLPRGVALTVEGERLFHRMHGALLDVAQAIDELLPQPAAGSLTVTTTMSFAALWLVPRLGRFYQAHPDVHVRIDSDGAPVDLHQDARIDVAIRYGTSAWPALLNACRLGETFGVYGSPARIAAAGEGTPELITVRWTDSTLYDDGWQAWCEAAGVQWLQDGATMRAYDEESYALQAAVAGQGLVLASSIMVSDSVRNGLLLPYRPDITVAGAAYTALCVPGRERHPPVRAFLAWLAREWG
ncbi:LysR family transcriptional regulator [Cupriavidus gilardii]|uniref:LysR substrate-binding domain-containing protein n=1 Tax=Cupriavidus gilardii TaxID=82541 RepID=UPI001EE5E208|nr:LysR substrate-binding domain-containing protein [Cupriavidus gilardii]MCG5262189.1 LysR substrate-binding domain-containing protein [Cupriavidus gilardii]MDF9430319.1 LysR family transcriptional regulator [Cupriavidus gilardii]